MPKIAIVIISFEIISTINLDVLSLTINNTDLINGLNNNGGFNINLIKNLLLISSFLSLIIGTIVGLAQIKIKRLLAYSTISHVGFLLLALAINSEQSIDSLIFYLIQYSLTNLNTFLIIIAFGLLLKNNSENIIGNFKGTEKDIKYIKELKGQFFANPLLSLSLTICLFSMAGIPPLIGFFSKQFVLYSAIQNGYYFMSIVGIIVSIISASYYLKIIIVLNTNSHNSTHASAHNNNNNNNNYTLSYIHTYLISCLSLIILFFIFKPSTLLNITRLLSLAIFNS